MTLTEFVLLTVLVGGSSWIVLHVASRSVSPERLARFMRRQALYPELLMTAPVEHYLTVTRMWRAAGMAAALCLTLAAGLRRGAIHLDLSAAFAGWFVGAIVAEWRLNPRLSVKHRSASLATRHLHHYLGVTGRALPWAVGAAGLAVAMTALSRGTIVIVQIALILLLLTTNVLIGRRILIRSQPADGDAADKATDDAIRSRSLHVLSGSTTALLVTLIVGLVSIHPVADPKMSRTPLIAALVLGSLVGWRMATMRFRVAVPGLLSNPSEQRVAAL